MNLLFTKPYSILFYSTLMLGIVVSLSSNNWFAIWIGLELNIYSFIPLLLQSKINQEKEAAVKYFLIQALASAILLFACLIYTSSFSPIFLLTSLIMKLALAPAHFWLPSIINSLSWYICWILTTVQKVAPLFILLNSLSIINSSFTSISAILSAAAGAVGGLNQTQLRAIIAYSSIGHLGWILAAAITSRVILLLYFITYVVIVSSIILIFRFYNLKTANPTTFFTYNSSYQQLIISLSLLRLGGLPPFLGFFPKLFVLYNLLQSSFVLLSFILILSSTINLYYYLKIVFLILIQKPGSFFFFSSPNIYKSLIISIIFCFSMLSGLFVFSIIV